MAIRQLSQIFSRIDKGIMIAALLALFAIQPLFKPGLPTTADLAIHIYRTLEFEQAWAPGVIAPRWAPNLAYGYGYPLFIFAPPLPYSLALLFQSSGVTLEIAFKALIIVTILLYAIGMYLFARDIFDSVEAGLVAATAYCFAPFALREGLLYGGNIPQFLAIGLFPWTLWAIRRAVSRFSWGWALLAAIFYAGVMLSHLFQILIFTPACGLYTLLLAVTKSRWFDPSRSRFGHLSKIIPSLSAIPLGLMLSAFFWLPAFLERRFTQAETNVYLEKSPFFVRYLHWSELVAWIQPLDQRAANPYVPLSLGIIPLILAGLGLAASIFKLITAQHQPKNNAYTASGQLFATVMFFALVAAGAIYMVLPISRSIWETIELLQVAEFPWRLLGLANLGLAVLAGAALLWLPKRLRRPAAGICIAVQLLAVGPLLYPVTAFTQYGQPTLADQINYERSSQSIGTTTLGEYLPRTVRRPPTTSPLVPAFQANTNPERLDPASLPAGSTATLVEQNAVTHRYDLDSPVPFTLRLFHFDYPGWQAALDSQPVGIRPEAGTGLMLIDIPAGQHTLTVQFGETLPRLLSLGLSGAALIGAIIVTLIMYRRRSPTAQSTPETTNTIPQNSLAMLTLIIFIVIAAFWLKPLARPFFTIHSPPDQVLPAQHATDIRFSNGIQLVGYDLPKRVLKPGDYIQVVLYWQTDQAPYRVNLQPFVHLDRLDDFTTVADATNYTPGDVTTESNLPTFHWDNHRYVRDEHDLIVPAGTPPQAYALRVGLIDPDQAGNLVALANSSGDTAWLDTINISPAGPTAALAQPLDVLFSNADDAIRLTGFETSSLTPDRLAFRLTWESQQRPQNNYTVFAQLLDKDRKLVASFDRPPLDGAYPTATWLPDQSILDPRSIPLTDVPRGDYVLIVGLYDPATGQRLATEDKTEFAELTTITIHQP